MKTIKDIVDVYSSRLTFFHEHPEYIKEDTFKNALTLFLADVDALRAVPHIRECRTYGHDLVVATNPGACQALVTTTTFR